ncbi:MAG: ANTAR domain-containing protein [Oscillospiraceae bacterium]|jgi:hypothetical protein|nr:ANTAR domain-containing protein [Oscillospiraceae bacterium]
MKEILLAAASPDILTALRRVLSDGGLIDVRLCHSGADALGACSLVREGLLICHKLRDMAPAALARSLPINIDVLLLLASGQRPLEGLGNVLCMNLPLDRPEFLRTVRELLVSGQQRRQVSHRRGAEDEAVILEAKLLLLERSGMPEWVAHRYLQQCAMRGGKTLIQAAREMIGGVEM